MYNVTSDGQLMGPDERGQQRSHEDLILFLVCVRLAAQTPAYDISPTTS